MRRRSEFQDIASSMEHLIPTDWFAGLLHLHSTTQERKRLA